MIDDNDTHKTSPLKLKNRNNDIKYNSLLFVIIDNRKRLRRTAAFIASAKAASAPARSSISMP